jgi:hypothetical protein
LTKYFELKGGLGNQLFQFFAGQNIARESGERMVFILPNSRQHKRHVDSSILDLDLPLIADTEFIDPRAGLLQFDRGRQWLSRKSEKSRRLFNRCSNTYVSGTIGFDPDLQNFIGSSFFKGYFQSYRYVDAFREVLEFTLTPVRPSLKYLEYLSEIREKRPTVMHIRRGDYKSLKKTIGSLSTDYYKNNRIFIP